EAIAEREATRQAERQRPDAAPRETPQHLARRGGAAVDPARLVDEVNALRALRARDAGEALLQVGRLVGDEVEAPLAIPPPHPLDPPAAVGAAAVEDERRLRRAHRAAKSGRSQRSAY